MERIYKDIVQFIRELYQQPTGIIPLHAPVFNGNEKKYLEECIDSTYVSSVGRFVDQFEEEMARYTGAKKAVACVNGTNALHIALMLVGVERDTEVITQPLTFVATANAIAYCGAHPVFIDVDMDTLGLSPSALRTWLNNSTIKRFNNSTSKRLKDKQLNDSTIQLVNKASGRRITACLPMHTFGHPCRIDEIIDICNEFGIPVVEDAAESLGSFYKKQHTGTFGEIGVLSFNGNKVLTTGGGGMLLFKDETLAKKAKHLTTQAKVPHPWEFNHDEIGYNYRMPNINAALGLAQLEQLPQFLASKRKIAMAYKDFFATLPPLNDSTTQRFNNSTTQQFNDSTTKQFNDSTIEFNIPFFPEPPHALSNYWLNCIFFPGEKERNEFLEYTNRHGIMSRPAWTLMNQLKLFKDASSDSLSNAEVISKSLVNLPSSVI